MAAECFKKVEIGKNGLYAAGSSPWACPLVVLAITTHKKFKGEKMNEAARLIALMIAATFCMVTAAHGMDVPPAKTQCKSDKKCDEQQRAATIKK